MKSNNRKYTKTVVAAMMLSATMIITYVLNPIGSFTAAEVAGSSANAAVTTEAPAAETPAAEAPAAETPAAETPAAEAPAAETPAAETPAAETPEEPTDPSQETTPTDPAQEPTDPSQETKPTDPSQETKPTDPSQETKPTDPSQETKPTDPSQETKPTDPSQETKPTDPSQETKPTDPSQETKPTDPSQETKPTDPSQETKPTDPSQETKPSQGTTPAQSAATQATVAPYAEQAAGDQSKSSTYSSNDALIAAQEILPVPQIAYDFRFVTIAKEQALFTTDISIYEETRTDSRVVGTGQTDGLCYIIKDDGSDWVYIESGVVRGFVESAQLIRGDEANTLVAKYQQEEQKKQTDAQKKLDKTGKIERELTFDEKGDLVDVEEQYDGPLCLAEATIDPIQNKALNYTRTTVRDTVVDKSDLIATEGVNILEEKDDKARVTGTLPKGGLAYLLSDENDDWYYVESGNVRGFVKADDFMSIEDSTKEVSESEEGSFDLATESMKPEENANLYYTITSTQEGRIGSALRSSIVQYALQFVGNPYVWGGTSLTNGADCSGFVQGVYRQYGYALPRVSGDQSQYGTKIDISQVQPGDLIFYARNGSVYHVVMYIGDGKVVQAESTKTGIVVRNLDMNNAVWATSIVTDKDEEHIENLKTEQKDIVSETASSSQLGEYLGNFKITAYCNCAICCGQWADGATASGTQPVQGRTIAMAGLPFGTKLVINGQVYTVEDRGTPYGHIDMYMNSHGEASDFGVKYADVYLLK